jgi:hypothetical protein
MTEYLSHQRQQGCTSDSKYHNLARLMPQNTRQLERLDERMQSNVWVQKGEQVQHAAPDQSVRSFYDLVFAFWEAKGLQPNDPFHIVLLNAFKTSAPENAGFKTGDQ